MIARAAFAVLASLSLLTAVGCAAADGSDAAASTEDELRTKDLNKYGMAVGIAATGPEARALYDAIAANGGKDLGDYRVLAGLTALDLGLAAAGDDDADEAFGISCQAKEGDSTFHADTCSIYAIVETTGQERGKTVLTGKLAKAVAEALPRTSPAGLVGSVTTGNGPVSCKTIPGPAGSTCTIAAGAIFTTFEAMIVDADGGVKAADVKKAVKAFFPGA